MPIRLDTPITKNQELTSQEVIDFRMTTTIPDGVDSISMLLADLDQGGGIMRPSDARPQTQFALTLPLLNDAQDGIREPANLDTWLPPEVIALRDGAGLTNQQLLALVFGTAKAWAYAAYDDQGESPILPGTLE